MKILSCSIIFVNIKVDAKGRTVLVMELVIKGGGGGEEKKRISHSQDIVQLGSLNRDRKMSTGS